MCTHGTIDVEKAAEELHEYIRDTDIDTIAELYEYILGNVEACWPSDDDPDTLIIEYVEGFKSKE